MRNACAFGGHYKIVILNNDDATESIRCWNADGELDTVSGCTYKMIDDCFRSDYVIASNRFYPENWSMAFSRLNCG